MKTNLGGQLTKLRRDRMPITKKDLTTQRFSCASASSSTKEWMLMLLSYSSGRVGSPFGPRDLISQISECSAIPQNAAEGGCGPQVFLKIRF
jgi:hypothetical protein